MAYEIIDEKMKIEACSLEDLTLSQALDFLRQWKDDNLGKIKTLTMFNKPDGTLVLNRDNVNFDTYLELARAYFAADQGPREQVRKKGGFLDEEFEVMRNCIRIRQINADYQAVMHQPVTDLCSTISGGGVKKDSHKNRWRHGVFTRSGVLLWCDMWKAPGTCPKKDAA